MLPKSETPHGGGVSRNESCGGSSRAHLSPIALQSQFLIASHHVRPEMASMIAALAFGGETPQ